jgi:predicted SnoaL-like aldol condensation-catalyzing enzyme
MRGLFLLAAASLIAASCAHGAASPPPSSAQCDNRDIVVAFYTEALVAPVRQPRAAFERYMAPNFTEHKPDIPGGTREATASFLEEVIAAVPQARWEIVRTIAEGDLVFLHVRFAPAEGAPAYAIADVFRVQDCRIVEHWDVVAGPVESAVNPNSRF